MRRVYYAFVLRAVSHPVVVHGTLLCVSIFALSRLVHVASIIKNISNLRVGDIDTYLLNTFMHAEFWTLATIGIIMFSLLSIPLSLVSPRLHRVQTT